MSDHLAVWSTATGDVGDIDAAVDALQARLAGLPASAPPVERVGALGALASSLQLRHERFGRRKDIDDAVRLASEALALADGTDLEASCRGVLGEVLRIRFESSRADADIDGAVTNLRRADALLATEGRPRSALLGSLSAALVSRAAQRGDEADGNAAVALAREAAAAPDLDPDLVPGVAHALALALYERFLLLGEVGDLAEAAEVLREAIAALSPGHPLRPVLLVNLGGVLLHRSHHIDRAEELEEAIAGNREALGLFPEDHPSRPIVEAGLANLILARARSAADPASLDESIRLSSVSIPAVPSVWRAGQQHVYARSLLDRYIESGSRRDLRAAVRALQSSVRHSSPDEPNLAGRLCSLATALEEYHGHTGRLRYRRRALAAARRATTAVTADSGSRLAAHWLSAELHHRAGEPSRAAEDYRAAVDLVPQVVWRGLGLVSQQARLRDVGGLAGDAAAAALDAGDPLDAVRLLEQGRTVILSQLFDIRTDRARLAAEHPDLCRRIDQLTAQLTSEGLLATTDVGDRWRLRARYDDAVAEARRLPGLADFLASPDSAALVRAADDGPVVLVNVSQLRCDALLMVPGDDQVRVLPLAGLTEDVVRDRAQAFDAAVATVDTSGDPEAVEAANARLAGTLAWLWRTVAEPVLSELGLRRRRARRDDGGLPRLWWCPTGALTTLPLHAAGLHVHPDDDDWVGAHVVSSYTPTVRALVQNRDTVTQGDGRQGALVVGVGAPPPVDGIRFHPLQGQAEEIEIVSAHTPKPRTVLPGAAGTRHAVLGALGSHAVAHLACHGHALRSNPSASFLAMADGPLRLHEIVVALGTGLDLAFLSACSTARSEPDLVDEALHLAAAFCLSGTRHVVGTLWSIDDATSPQVARDVYSRVSGHDRELRFDDTARGLHDAVARLRRRPDTATPIHWAPYVHFGP